MDYNGIKLGLVGRFKVWRARRKAEKGRNWRDDVEGEISEVDYSEADRLKAELLDKKRTKKATKDASLIYRQYFRKNNDGMGEADFIKNYLIENGLKQKKLPEPETTKGASFMEQYPTEKTPEEVAYEKDNTEPKIYYTINGEKYELPSKFLLYASSQDLVDNIKPLEGSDNGKYVLVDDKIKPDKMRRMLTYLIDSSLRDIAFNLAFHEPDEDMHEKFSSLARRASAKEWLTKELVLQGKEDEATAGLKEKLGDILKFRNDMSKSKEEER